MGQQLKSNQQGGKVTISAQKVTSNEQKIRSNEKRAKSSTSLKPYIDMDTDLRKKRKKIILKKAFSKLMDNALF